VKTSLIYDIIFVFFKFRLEHLWSIELKRNPTNPNFTRTVIHFFRYRLALSCLIFVFCIVFGFIGPTCIVRGLISFLEKPSINLADGTIDRSYGWALAFGMFFVRPFFPEIFETSLFMHFFKFRSKSSGFWPTVPLGQWVIEQPFEFVAPFWPCSISIWQTRNQQMGKLLRRFCSKSSEKNIFIPEMFIRLSTFTRTMGKEFSVGLSNMNHFFLCFG
jgi:hypothetical protein